MEASRESASARARAVGASGRASRMLEVASVGSLASAAISCGESLFDALVPANGDLSFSEAKVRSAFFLDDFERALRPLHWSVFARYIETWNLLTMPRAELSDYHDWPFPTTKWCEASSSVQLEIGPQLSWRDN